jgi:hypothetical protein
MKYWGYKIVIPPLWDAETTVYARLQSVITTNVSLPPLIDGPAHLQGP